MTEESGFFSVDASGFSFTDVSEPGCDSEGVAGSVTEESGFFSVDASGFSFTDASEPGCDSEGVVGSVTEESGFFSVDASGFSFTDVSEPGCDCVAVSGSVTEDASGFVAGLASGSLSTTVSLTGSGSAPVPSTTLFESTKPPLSVLPARASPSFATRPVTSSLVAESVLPDNVTPSPVSVMTPLSEETLALVSWSPSPLPEAPLRFPASVTSPSVLAT